MTSPMRVASSVSRAAISSITPTHTPSVGSSSRSSFGRVRSARPTASILRSPPLSVPARWSSRWPSFGNRERTSSMAAGSRRVTAPTARFSRTDSRPKTACS